MSQFPYNRQTMTENKTYKIDSLRAISETLEGETIIINLENGNYYSMNETGSALWNQIGSGCSVDRIMADFVSNYDVDAETATKAINTLVESLLHDGLILETEPTEPSPSESTSENSHPRKAFVAPAIERYEDMQEMILADPVHDVGAMGWPKLKKDM